jgi:hypothetical protein
MSPSGIWRHVAIIRTDVSEERITSIDDRDTVTEALFSICHEVHPIRLFPVSYSVLFLRNMLRLVVTAIVVPSSLILLALMMQARHSSETSVLTRATRHHVPQDDNLLDVDIICGFAECTSVIK